MSLSPGAKSPLWGEASGPRPLACAMLAPLPARDVLSQPSHNRLDSPCPGSSHPASSPKPPRFEEIMAALARTTSSVGQGGDLGLKRCAGPTTPRPRSPSPAWARRPGRDRARGRELARDTRASGLHCVTNTWCLTSSPTSQGRQPKNSCKTQLTRRVLDCSRAVIRYTVHNISVHRLRPTTNFGRR